jgi:hypothetical protein
MTPIIAKDAEFVIPGEVIIPSLVVSVIIVAIVGAVIWRMTRPKGPPGSRAPKAPARRL